MPQPFKTARCILYQENRFLLAVHGSFWGHQHRRWGLPGGRIEWGESPEIAVARELEEELSVFPERLLTIGPYTYKKALHMVYAAELSEPIHDWDESELIDVRWFSEEDVAELKARNSLHANYELDAIRALRRQLAD